MARAHFLKPFPIFIHVILWIVYLLWIGYVNVLRYGISHIWVTLGMLPVMLGIFYLNWYGLRRFFLKGARWKDVAFSVLYLLALLFVGYQILYGHPNEFARKIRKDPDTQTFNLTMYVIEVVSFYWTFAYKGLGIAAIEILFNLARARIAYLHGKHKDRSNQRKKIRMKKWISHFLGNMTQSLVGSAKQGKATASMLESYAIIWAFGIRMMARETKFFIPLDTELYHLRRLKVIYPINSLDMKIRGDIRTIDVLPMLLLNIYKNMYKHGEFTDNSEALFHVTGHADRLTIRTENRVAARSRWIFEHGGTGLVQLEGILQQHYGSSATMMHKQQENIFYLQIEISFTYGRVQSDVKLNGQKEEIAGSGTG